MNKIAFNTSIALSLVGIALVGIALFPDGLSRILSICLGVMILFYAMYVKVQESEVNPPTATIENKVKIPHKVKIIT